MKGRAASATRRSGCPISIALEMLGDSWSLLIIRDLMFKGRRRFGEFLEAGEGIATNILSDRLARLERAGIVDRVRDPRDARRYLYRLTEKGIALAPVLVELVLWSAGHEDTDAPPEQIARMREDREAFVAEVQDAMRALRARDSSRGDD